MLPLFFPAIAGYVYFIVSILMYLFSNLGVPISWEAGILGSVSYGFIAVRNFMENTEKDGK